jgi:circadian clock protein KaiB
MSTKPSDKRPGQDDSPPPDVLQLRLYVTGRSPNSVRALTNLRAMCGEWLADDGWQLEVVDVFADPMRAVEDKILVTPTLLKLTPPIVQIIGDLSQRETVVAALDLDRRKE